MVFWKATAFPVLRKVLKQESGFPGFPGVRCDYGDVVIVVIIIIILVVVVVVLIIIITASYYHHRSPRSASSPASLLTI